MRKINAIINDVCNMINGAVNKQVMKFFVKKNGEWMPASRMDLLFFKSEHMPKRRGDLLQSNTWNNHILAVFIANENGKDTSYISRQLKDAEEMAPEWLRESSNEKVA